MTYSESNNDPVKYLLEGIPLDNNLSTSENERHQSILNILRGYEEFVLDTTGNIISSNLEAVNITGYEEWEVLGKNISIFYPPVEQIRNKPAEDLVKAEDRGEYVYNGVRVKKRGSPFYSKMKIVAIRASHSSLSGSNPLKGFRVTIQDTTHRVLSKYSVRELKDEYSHLFNNAFIGIFKFRISDGKTLNMNDRALKITLRTKSRELLFNTLFAKEKDYKNLIKKVTTSGRVEGFEFLIQSDDGIERWCSISCKHFPVKDFVEGILIDITDMRKQTQQLNQLSTDIDNFIYHASHDLRAPLSSMLGLVNLLGIDNSGGNTTEYLRMLKGRICHLDHLLRDMVAIAYNSKAKVMIERVNLREIIKGIIREMSNIYSTVKVDFTAKETLPFYNDHVRILQILRNVISNAFKFHHSSSPFVRIEFSITESQVLFIIKDNGKGIPEEAQEKIFGLFYKAEVKEGGSGLGLYVTKAMVDKLAGEVKVESNVGYGTCIKISIPNKNLREVNPVFN